MKVVTDELVVVNLGHPAQELFALCDRPQNFYMLGSMGLCSSIGHGLALSQGKNVIVIDGDAAATMNLNGFATVGHTQPKNFIHIIIDNAANGSTGFQPSFTAGSLRLDEVSRACGIGKVISISEQSEICPALSNILKDQSGPHVVVIRTETGMPSGIGVIPLGPLEIKARFCSVLSQDRRQ
jgi:sulfopyruvate decarboxylase subunit beta